MAPGAARRRASAPRSRPRARCAGRPARTRRRSRAGRWHRRRSAAIASAAWRRQKPRHAGTWRRCSSRSPRSRSHSTPIPGWPRCNARVPTPTRPRAAIWWPAHICRSRHRPYSCRRQGLRLGAAGLQAGALNWTSWSLGDGHQATQPPQTGNTCPTKHEAASLARYAANSASSSPETRRPSGTSRFSRSWNAGFAWTSGGK